MKKIISVLLAVVMLCGCMTVIAFAADGYTNSYFVKAPTENAKKYEITPYGDQTTYVKEGDSFRFVITELGSYTMNDTCVVKAAPTDYPVQSIIDADAIEGEVLYPEEVTVTEINAKGEEVEVTYEVYTLNNVTSDMYIYVCNVAQKSVSGVLDFLNGLFNFFVDFIKWFFGLTVRN